MLEYTNGQIIRTHCSSTSACHSAWPHATVESAGRSLADRPFKFFCKDPILYSSFQAPLLHMSSFIYPFSTVASTSFKLTSDTASADDAVYRESMGWACTGATSGQIGGTLTDAVCVCACVCV